MALQRIGNQLVLSGVGKYISDSEKVNKAIEKNNAALKKQVDSAAKVALSTGEIEKQSRSLARRVLDAFTAPFRMLGNLMRGIFSTATNVAKTAILGPFKILGSLAANVLKGVIVASITSRIVSWIFEGKAPIPAGWKDKIAQGLTGMFHKLGGETGVKFWGAFKTTAATFLHGKLGDMLSSAIGLTTKGPLGMATNKIVGSIFAGFGKAKNIAGAINDNGAWGDLFKNIGTGGVNAIKNFGAAIEPIIGRIETLGTTILGAIGPNIMGAVSSGLSALATKIVAFLPIIGGLVAAFVGLKLVFKLGQRGSAFEGVIASFDILARQAQVVPAMLLDNMRKAANGTISDLDLITNANLALAGATGETAKIVGEGLPKLLEIARAQARSTGKDVNFLFNSLVEGVKKAQPELIDNTGLLVRIGEANEELAKKLGKSVDALSAQERQQAILNATLKAGESAVKQLAGAELTAAEIQQQIDTNRKNSLDSLALAIQPVYKVFLTFQRTISGVILSVVRFIAPFIYKTGLIIAEFVKGISGVINRLLVVFKPALNEIKYAAAVISLVFDWIRIATKTMAQVLFWSLDQIGVGLNWLGSQLLKIFPFLSFFQDGLFMGAAKAFGAFAAGILQAANKYIFPAVITIATFIADFLMGESPPPMGPLSTIDKGGANVMKAWLDGVIGVSLEPVSQVAEQVTSMLGDVANYSLAQVKTRFAELDAALQPFQDRLDLVKASLEAMNKPLETAKDIISKKLDKAAQLLTTGGGDAGMVQALDRQLELINQRMTMNDEEIQQAQLQFELAQAMQAQERAQLTIRERMLGVTESISDAVDKATEDKKPTGAGETTTPSAAGLPALTGGMGAGDSILGLDAIKGALSNLSKASYGAFQDAGGDAALAEAKSNIGKLGLQTNRIGKGASSLKDKILAPFKGIANDFSVELQAVQDAFDGVFSFISEKLSGKTGFGTVVSDFVDGMTLDFGEFRTLLSDLGVDVDGLFGKKSYLGSIFSETGLFGAKGPMNQALSGMFGEGGTLAGYFDSMTLSVSEVKNIWDTVFGPSDTEGTLLYNLASFKTNIGTLFDSIFNNADSPVQKIITSVMNVVDTVWSWFNALTNPQGPYSISEAFAALKSTIQTALVNPVVDAVESMMNSVIDSINKAIETVWDAMPGVVQAAARRAGLDLGSFQISHIDIPYPTFHEGGVVRANLLKGEGVLSIPMMKTLASLEKTMRIPSYSPPVIVSGGRGNSSVDRSLNIENIHYHEQQRSAKRTVRELRSLAARNGI